MDILDRYIKRTCNNTTTLWCWLICNCMRPTIIIHATSVSDLIIIDAEANTRYCQLFPILTIYLLDGKYGWVARFIIESPWLTEPTMLVSWDNRAAWVNSHSIMQKLVMRWGCRDPVAPRQLNTHSTHSAHALQNPNWNDCRDRLALTSGFHTLSLQLRR